jgi:folate-binding protein YgfZ
MNLAIYNRIVAGESLTCVLSPRALWRLTGPDATRYLNGQVTNDIAHLTDGRNCYAAVCTAKGRMEGDVSISRHAGDFYLDADAALRESLGARLEKYLIADDAAFEDISDLWSLSHVFGATPPSVPVGGFAISNARFGPPGHDIWLESADAFAVGDTVEPDVIETLRLEHGIPRWGAELTAMTLPPEAGPHMLKAISYTKGCYVGQETIARLKSVGHVNRSLVFLRGNSAAFPASGTKLTQSEREVGSVTSSGYSPRLKQGIALGYAQRNAAVEGTPLEAGGLFVEVASPFPSEAS